MEVLLRLEGGNDSRNFEGKIYSALPAGPAWEIGQSFVFNNISAHGVDSGMKNASKTIIRFRAYVNGG